MSTSGPWLSLLVAIVLAAASAGCGPVYRDFAYPPNELPNAPGTGLKIAVIPFVDERENKDEGSHAWSWLPGVLWATEARDQKQRPEAVARTEYFYPGLAAYTIALDLAHNAIGARVDVAPPALEDYDIIIHGKLTSFEERDQVLTYGLGPLSFATNWIGLPQGRRTVHLEATYVAYDTRGETVIEAPIADGWSAVFWNKEQAEPIMHGRVMTLKAANRHFLDRLAVALVAPPFVPEPDAIAQRLRLYHMRLDPDLSQLVAERARAQSRQASGYATALDREIRRRASYLESYRRTEDRIISDQQKFVWQRQHEMLVQTAQARALQRETEAQHDKMKSEAFHASMRPIAGALVAGTLPALGAAQSAGQWSTPQWEMLTKDLSASLAVMPPPPPPPPDLSAMLDELGIDAARSGSPGELLGEIHGTSIPDLRNKFLKLYAEKRTPLATIRAAALGTAPRPTDGATP